MRNLISTLTLVFAIFILLPNMPTFAGDDMNQLGINSQCSEQVVGSVSPDIAQISKTDAQMLEEFMSLTMLGANGSEIVGFCGQCTKNSDCGSGYKCAGRPECMECVKSP